MENGNIKVVERKRKRVLIQIEAENRFSLYKKCEMICNTKKYVRAPCNVAQCAVFPMLLIAQSKHRVANDSRNLIAFHLITFILFPFAIQKCEILYIHFMQLFHVLC